MKIIEQYQEKINGEFSTFDRMIIKGHILGMFSESGKKYFLSKENVLLKNFGAYSEKLTEEIKAHVEKIAKETGRPNIYLNSPKISKEETALKALKDNPIEEGLICIIGTVETCTSVDIFKNKKTHRLELRPRPRKCLHYYFYYLDKEFGFMHLKLQSWLPFTFQIYINGREYVAKQLDKENIKYTRFDNCFTSIENLERAKEIAKNIEAKDFSAMFDVLANRVNPILKRMTDIFGKGYYWCLEQCEYATDIMFKDRKSLEEIYPSLVEHALINFKCEDVMTFLGRKLHGSFQGEVVSDVKKRSQGVRIKHRMKSNSIKMYDKYSVLRVETTINSPKEFKISKSTITNGVEKIRWAPMGKSISNLYRYAQVSESANKKYLEALAATKNTGEQVAEIEKLSEKVVVEGRTYSGLNLMSNYTCKLFEAIMSGANYINGFRNVDIREALFSKNSSKKIRNKVTRLLAKLKAFGLITKIKNSFRYKPTSKGIKVMSTVLKFKKKDYAALAG